MAILYRKNVDATLADTLAHNWKNDGKLQNKKKTQKDNTADRNPRTFRIDNREITIMKTAGLLFLYCQCKLVYLDGEFIFQTF